jgi:hypothetical protein
MYFLGAFRPLGSTLRGGSGKREEDGAGRYRRGRRRTSGTQPGLRLAEVRREVLLAGHREAARHRGCDGRGSSLLNPLLWQGCFVSFEAFKHHLIFGRFHSAWLPMHAVNEGGNNKMVSRRYFGRNADPGWGLGLGLGLYYLNF